jgi:hypothetical protein
MRRHLDSHGSVHPRLGDIYILYSRETDDVILHPLESIARHAWTKNEYLSLNVRHHLGVISALRKHSESSHDIRLTQSYSGYGIM